MLRVTSVHTHVGISTSHALHCWSMCSIERCCCFHFVVWHSFSTGCLNFQQQIWDLSWLPCTGRAWRRACALISHQRHGQAYTRVSSPSLASNLCVDSATVVMQLPRCTTSSCSNQCLHSTPVGAHACSPALLSFTSQAVN